MGCSCRPPGVVGVWGASTTSRVRQVASTPSLAQTRSAVASAMARRVVALPPVMVTNPSTPSVTAWSKHLKVRDSSRPPPSGAAGGADQRPGRGPGGPLGGRGHRRDQLGALAVHRLDMLVGHLQVVGVADGPGAGPDDRQAPLGHHDVPVAGRVQAVDDQVTQPADQRQEHLGDGWTGTVAPAMAARRSHQGPVALTTRSAASSASAPVRWSRSVTPVTARSAVSSPVTSVNALGAVAPGGGEEPQRQPHGVHGGVRDPDGRFERRVQAWLQGQGLVHGQLLGRDATGRAAGQEPGR